MKRVELLPTSLVSGLMSSLPDSPDVPALFHSNKRFLEAYKELITEKKISFNDFEESSAEFSKVECLQFDPTTEFFEKNLSYFLSVRELNFVSGFKFALRILRSKNLSRDKINRVCLSAPGLIVTEGESFLSVRLPRLKKLEIMASNKHQPKVLSDFIQHLCLYSKLIYLRLDSLILDGSVKMPYSLTLKHLRIDLIGKNINFNVLNIFFPALYELEIYYIQDPADRFVTGTLRTSNFPSLKKMTLRNLRPLLQAGKESITEKNHIFLPLEGRKWKNISHLSVDFLTMAFFGSITETFENLSHFHVFVGVMNFQMLPGKTTEALPRQLTSATIEAQKLSLIDPYDPNPFYGNVTHLVLKLEEFDMRTLSTLTSLEYLKDLSLILVPLSGGGFSLAHPEFSESDAAQQSLSQNSNRFNDSHGAKKSYSFTELDDSDYSVDDDGTFETLVVLRVTYPTRMHKFICWIVCQSPYLSSLILSETLHPMTAKICKEKSPSLDIFIH